jgi:hypothetical protein
MVEQAGARLPGALTAGTSTAAYPGEPPAQRRAPLPPPAPATLPEPALTAPYLIAAIVVALLIPGSFTIGVQLSPNRLLLLGLLPFLVWNWLHGMAGRPTVPDVLMLFGTLWIGLALIINNGLGYAPRGVILMVELFGGYLIGRMLIRHTGDYRFFFKLLTWGFLFLLPFALVEMVTGKNLIRPIFGHIFSIPPRQVNLGKRLGLVRAQTVFEHPILMGIVASMCVTNMLYMYRDKFLKSLRLAGFFLFMTFTTISSGPMLSIGIQLCLTLWDRVLRFLSFRWILLALLGLAGLVAIRFAAEFHLLDFVIQNFMFNPNTADGRLVILEYGTAEIIRHPIFGIGASDWVRPFYKKPSVDNFWLGHAMRYGLPSFLMIAAAIAIGFSRIVSQKTLSRQQANYRTGYLITLVGIVVTLGTVYIWSATSVFVMIFIGAGAMFYVRDVEDEGPDPDARARRAAQARAFGSAPAPVPSTPKPTPTPAPTPAAASGAPPAAAAGPTGPGRGRASTAFRPATPSAAGSAAGSAVGAAAGAALGTATGMGTGPAGAPAAGRKPGDRHA